MLKDIIIMIDVYYLFNIVSLTSANQPMPNLDMMTNAFWDYVATVTLTTTDTLQKIRQSELGQEVNARIVGSAGALSQYSTAVSGQVMPMAQDLMVKLYQEAEQLKGRLEQDLGSSMDYEALKINMMQKSEELRGAMEKTMKELRANWGPYTAEVEQKVQQHLQDFQTNITPLAQSLQTLLLQKGQELQQNFGSHSEELKKQLDPYAQDLKAQLTSLWESFTKSSN
uniref:Apolipoprotein A-IV n=1 Tax=Denticeps clupeoides TaxID=299321 RepID=A0AAY4DMC2_9TELE